MSESETRTFKNVRVRGYNSWGGSESNTGTQTVTSRGNSVGYEESFNDEDWDMEVMFIRKVKPFVPGYYRKVGVIDSERSAVLWFDSSWEPSSSVKWEPVDVTPKKKA